MAARVWSPHPMGDTQEQPRNYVFRSVRPNAECRGRGNSSSHPHLRHCRLPFTSLATLCRRASRVCSVSSAFEIGGERAAELVTICDHLYMLLFVVSAVDTGADGSWPPIALSVAAPRIFFLFGMVKVPLGDANLSFWYVGYRLVNPDWDRRKMRQWCASSVPLILSLLMWIAMFLIVCLPVMTHEDTEMFDRVFLWLSLILTPVAYLSIFVPCSRGHL